jgi:hypothetical protein
LEIIPGRADKNQFACLVVDDLLKFELALPANTINGIVFFEMLDALLQEFNVLILMVDVLNHKSH